MSEGTKPTILLIEADASLRRLMVLGLQYRGMSIVEAHSPNSLPLVEVEQLSLLVLDVDGGVKSDWSLLPAIRAYPLLKHLPMIVLAWDYTVPMFAPQHVPSADRLATPAITYLAKPFDARALYATIDQLLLSQDVPAVQGGQEVAQLPVKYIASTAPSMYPMITAAGLLLAFIGLMGVFVLTFLGLAVVLVSLLAWTLGTSSAVGATTRAIP